MSSVATARTSSPSARSATGRDRAASTAVNAIERDRLRWRRPHWGRAPAALASAAPAGDGRGGVDRLVDPAAVVAEEGARGVDDGGRAAVVDLEVVGGGAGEVALVVDEEAGVGAGVAVDDLVVVADAEHVGGGAGHQADQQEVGGREVLELVDQQRPRLGPDFGPQVGVAQQQLHRQVDLLVEVEAAGAVEHVAVGRKGGRDAGGVGVEVLRLLRRDQPEADGGQGVEVRRQRVGADLAGRLHQPGQDLAAERLVGDAPVAAAGADVEAQRVERADGGPEPGGALPELVGGHHVVGHRRDQPRLVTPVDQQVPDPLGQHPGLPRPRRSDDPGRPAGMRHRRQLIRSQLRRGFPIPGRRQHPGIDRVPVHDDRGRPGAAGSPSQARPVATKVHRRPSMRLRRDRLRFRPTGPGGGGRRRTRRGCRREGGRRPGRRGWRRSGRRGCRATRWDRRACGRRRCWPRRRTGGARARR